MAYTPLLKKLNRQGSTFYTFSSAAKDLSKCLGNSSVLEFRFSHFALLNIPDIINAYSPTTVVAQPTGNKMDITSGERFKWWTNIEHKKKTSYMLATMLQNYVFNFEECLISRSVPTDTHRSLAERVFWHWMYHTGAISWREAVQGSEVVPTRTRRIEGNEGTEAYSRVVQYLGNIDITNNVDINSDAYTELYIHTPAEAGYTPKILWLNDNTGENDIFAKDTTYECENRSTIFGQGEENPNYTSDEADDNPEELSYCAIYDVNGNGQDDCYITEDSDNEGVCIDFDAESYWDIMNNASVNTMDEYNASGMADTFEFNAVLVYYDIIDKGDGSRTSNLYGIMFLDDVISVNGGEYVQRYPKYKPTEGAVNGNSYGFKLNLRIDIEPNKQGITTLVNEYNTYSMGLFADAIMRIQECTNTFMHIRDEHYELARKYNELETIIKSIYSVDALKKRVDELERTMEDAGIALSDTNAILDIIYNNGRRIDELVEGKLPNSLALGLDVIKSGYGIDIDTGDNKSARIALKGIGWQQCPVTLVNDQSFGVIGKDNPISLGNTERGDNRIVGIMVDGNNMVRIHTDAVALCQHDIEVYIDDSLSSWHNGQTLRIVFPTLPKATLNTHRIKIYTDKACRSGHQTDGMGYGCECIVVSGELVNDNPIIDITCIDENFTLGNDSIIADVIR